MKRINKWIIFALGICLVATPLTVYGASIIKKNYAYVPPAYKQVLKQESPKLTYIKNKMSAAIINYDTLEASYSEKQNNTIAKYGIVIDYKNNNAIGTIADDKGILKMEYLINNKKALEYNHSNNTYAESPTLYDKREIPAQRTSIIEGHRAINFSKNPLPLPLGRAAIAINPEQYALELMEDSAVSSQGPTQYLNRPAEIIDIQLPPVLQEKSNSDRIEFIVDNQTGAILKFTQFKGNEVNYELAATEFKVNQAVDQKIFKIDIPKTAKMGGEF
jgi:hypothetical protein